MKITAKKIECAGGCSKTFSACLGIAYCPTCWNVDRICKKEAVSGLAELRARCRSRSEMLFRVSDLLRRCGADDAEPLIAELERRCQ